VQYLLQKLGDFFHIAYLQKFYKSAFFVQDNPFLTYTNNPFLTNTNNQFLT
jgi:hypothetical protein